MTNCKTCAKASVTANGVGAYNVALVDCSATADGYGIAAEANLAGGYTNGAIKACPTSCKACGKINVTANGVGAYSFTLVDCTVAVAGYGLVGTAGAYTAVLPCPTNCATCTKATATTAFTVADCLTPASGYQLVGSSGAYTGITACNAGCATCTSSDLCATCVSGSALLLGTKLCYVVATTYILDTAKFANTIAAGTFKRGINAVTCKDGYSPFNGMCISC